MLLWLFRFTQTERLMISVRVAAPDRQTACDLLGEKLGRPLLAKDGVHPEEGTILTVFGKADVPSARIMAYTDLNGVLSENML